MKCTNRRILTSILFTCIVLVSGCGRSEILTEYEQEHFNKSIYNTELFGADLIAAVDRVTLSGYGATDKIYGTALFELESGRILQSSNLLEPLSPASTTKIMTAYVALKYGNVDDIVTVSKNAVDLPSGSSLANLREGDTLTLFDLVVGLTAVSGNDAAIAIAEHISGTEGEFAQLMTKEAISLGATHTSFKNAHGLDEEGHTTTTYDLYLMFNEVIKDSRYTDILADTSYITSIKNNDGSERQVEWIPSNFYHQGKVKTPLNFTVIGGKTGTTSKAKNCLVALMENSSGEEYVVITMGAQTKDILYEKMTELIENIPN